jgi:DNA topoisomerase-3
MAPSSPPPPVLFTWSRGHLFDMLATLAIYETCLSSSNPLVARVASVVEKPKSKWRPLPLTTVELQKTASTKLRMTSDRIMVRRRLGA